MKKTSLRAEGTNSVPVDLQGYKMLLSGLCKSGKKLVVNEFEGNFLGRGYEGRRDDNIKFQRS